jgi:hypothetical protein
MIRAFTLNLVFCDLRLKVRFSGLGCANNSFYAQNWVRIELENRGVISCSIAKPIAEWTDNIQHSPRWSFSPLRQVDDEGEDDRGDDDGGSCGGEYEEIDQTFPSNAGCCF